MALDLLTDGGETGAAPVARSDDPQRAARRRFWRGQVDAWRLYHLALARTPESPDTVKTFGDHDIGDQLNIFFGSAEFVDRVVKPLVRGTHAELGSDPSRSLVFWASRRLPLSDDGRRAVRDSETWPSLYLALFDDEVFRRLFRPDQAAANPDFVRALRRAALFRGGLEEARSDFVKGWVYCLKGSDPSRRVEIWIDGAFAAAGSPSIFRRDVQDHVGGDGLAGFEIPLPPEPVDRTTPMRIEVREAASGYVIGSAVVERTPPSTGVLSSIALQIKEVRAQLDRLERQLPVVQHQVSSSLESYGLHYDRWLRPECAAKPQGSITVVLDALGYPSRNVADAVGRILEQASEGVALVVLADARIQSAVQDLLVRAAWRGVGGHRMIVSAPDRRCEDIMGVVAQLDADDLLFLTRASHVLEKTALADVTAALAGAPGCDALYGDEDAFLAEDLARDTDLRRHRAPAFKPAFDEDLFHQQPYVGSCIAFRAGSLKAAGLRTEAGEHYGCDTLLRLETDVVGHLDRLLSTRWPTATSDATAWGECVREHLATRVEGARIEPRADSLGAEVAGAVRVRYPSPPGTRVAIIIPTRDRLDLIKPCLDSLLDKVSANRCTLEIIVVDHQNSDVEVIDYLEDRRQAGLIQVVPFEGAFNWALMNNLAAAQTEAEVLVFLNDDTIVITPDWLDELASQALRPGVGVVGCRLVYADGTIQHAGFVMRETEATFLIHDGVGAPGSDGGYLGRHALLHQAAAVTGACIAVSKDVFRRLGGFDAANFPVEGNDVDLCFRAAAAGLKVIYDPYATLYHLESKTRGFSADGERRRVSETALALLWDRWGAGLGTDPGFNMNFDRWGRPFARLRPPPPASLRVYPVRRI